MQYAIIAAGEGSRLVEEGIMTPKPLLSLHGETLIDRLIRVFQTAGATSISIIVNEEMTAVYDHLRTLDLPIPFHLIRKSTPSSMHSFFELSHTLQREKFCLTTVDTLFYETEFYRYIDAFQQSTCDGMMGVTDYIDDEKPLYVATDEALHITDFLDAPDDAVKYVSGGIYGLTPVALDLLAEAMQEGLFRMRNYQRRLVASGLRLQAHPFTKIIDIDHASDIEKAALFVTKQ